MLTIKNSDQLKKRNFSASNNNPIVIGCASRLLRDKGIVELIDAVKIVALKHHVSLKILERYIKRIHQVFLKKISSFRQKGLHHVFGKRIRYGWVLAQL